MTEHEKSLEIINELNLSLVEVGDIIGCKWQSVQKKKSRINNNKFTLINYEKLDQHKKKKITKLKLIK